jgi:hypothetical protein
LLAIHDKNSPRRRGERGDAFVLTPDFLRSSREEQAKRERFFVVFVSFVVKKLTRD